MKTKIKRTIGYTIITSIYLSGVYYLAISPPLPFGAVVSALIGFGLLISLLIWRMYIVEYRNQLAKHGILTGKDAERFHKSFNNSLKASPEERERIIKQYNSIKVKP